MGFAYILVLAFGAYAALKFYEDQKEIEKDLKNRQQAPPGVSYYCNLAVTQRPQQVQAFLVTNAMQTTQPGYAPAFGPVENMPTSCQELFL